MSEKITQEHLIRLALLYIRQSSQRQVIEHQFGQQVQYDVVERAKELGWPEKKIKIIDEDLGLTATGTGERPGFEKLLSQICLGKVGAIFILYASRLARNGKDWHTILQMCALFNVLIIDRNTVFDPRQANDRLWLGMQGSFSEYESSQMLIRAKEAILQKASQGKLFKMLPAGFELTEDRERIELDPDQRVQQAIRGVFSRFDQLLSVRQVAIWYQQHKIEVPVRNIRKPTELKWRIPDYDTIYRIMDNPYYAGIYMYPKTKTITRLEDGIIVKTSGHKNAPDDITVVINDLFPSYITNEQYQKNKQIIADNAVMKPNTTTGAPREGKSILAGLLFCGHCSRKLWVRYPSKNSYPYYFCGGEVNANIRQGCISFGGRNLESLVVDEIIKVLQPEAIEATIRAQQQWQKQAAQESDAAFYALEQARYEANRIERQLKRVEPEKYLVFKTFTQRWQEALEKVHELEDRYDQLKTQQPSVTDEDKQRLFELADDLTTVWYHPKSDARIKKRIVRLLIKQIWVKLVGEKTIHATIHWHGGVHTELELNRRHRRSSKKDVPKQPCSIHELIKKLVCVCDDMQIARILNLHNYPNKDGQSWSQSHVTQLRQHHHIAPFSEQAYSKLDKVTLEQAADILHVSMSTVSKMIRFKLIQANQVIKHAPWEIDRHELEKPAVKKYLMQLNKNKRVTCDENQITFDLNNNSIKEQ